MGNSDSERKLSSGLNSTPWSCDAAMLSLLTIYENKVLKLCQLACLSEVVGYPKPDLT